MSPVIGPDGQVNGVAAIARDITERKEFEAQLQFLADHDVLTGLFNRRRFIDTLSHHIDLVNRYGPGGAVLILDLDNFKEINDTLGHSAGDETIRAASAVLERRLRSSDVVARLSGDEFAVLLAQADEEESRRVAADLLELLRQQPIFVGGRSVRVTASVGVALFQPDEKLDSEGLLASADMAMYQAKEAGRDQVAIYSGAPERQTLIEERISWPERVRSALANDGMSLFLQPIKDLQSGHISQWEALVRLSEGSQLILPGAFLGAAERSGLVIELDRWVVAQAIELIAPPAGPRARHPARGEPVGRSVGDEELPGGDRGDDRRARHRRRPPDLRGHRDGRDREHGRGARVRRVADPPGLPVRAGRLRRRIRLLLLPQVPAARLPEDRRRLHPQAEGQRGRSGPGARDGRGREGAAA